MDTHANPAPAMPAAAPAAPTGADLTESPAINELAAALAKAQGAFSNPAKDRENPHFRSRYATLDAVFGMDEVDDAGIRETAEESMGRLGRALEPHLNERALAIALQRVVGACIGSAFGAGLFYSNKVSEAQAATSRLLNGGADEDREEGTGFETQAQRKREFAAEVGLQARALLVAAEGALSAYAHLTGEEWKPYTPPATPGGAPPAVSRDAAKAQMGAFD